MHRGTVFIITKDKDNKFKIQKSTEFNGGMGIENLGGAIYDMLKNFKEPLLFDAMIRDFDERYFKYGDEVMTYSPDEQHNPYIDKEGNEYFEYSQTENQFKFFKDDNGEYIYTSDSNYIKNMSDEDITVVCSNGNYVLKQKYIFGMFFVHSSDYFTQTAYQSTKCLVLIYKNTNWNYMRLWGMNVILPFKSGNWLDSHFTLITMQMRQRCDNFFDIPFDRKKCEVTPKSWTS